MTERRAHKLAHPTCPQGASSWGACDKAFKERLGRCTELTQDKKNPTECTRWAGSLVGESKRAMCDMHAGMVIEREAAAIRTAERKQRLYDMAVASIRSQGQVPHDETHDEFGCPESHMHPSHVCYEECFYWGETLQRRAATAASG